MDGTLPASRQVEEARREARPRVLRCRGCGSREPVRAPARRHGWQRCRPCGTVIVAPWSDWEAYDGPSARTVVLERPGRVHFVVPRRPLLRDAFDPTQGAMPDLSLGGAAARGGAAGGGEAHLYARDSY